MYTPKRPVDIEPIHQILPRVLKSIEKRLNGDTLPPVCLETVNEIAMGFPKGPTVISARTSNGKTAFMLQNAISLALKGFNVLFLSLEDTRLSCTEKVLSNLLMLDNRNLKEGKLDEQYKEIALDAFLDLPFGMADGFGFNMDEIKRAYELSRFKNGKSADIIFWDYIQMLDGAGLDTYNKFMTEIRLWSIENEVSFVAGCQQNRWSVSKDGSISNAGVKGSGSIEEVAEMIILLCYPYQLGIEVKNLESFPGFNHLTPEEKNAVWMHYFEISISKNKTGPTKHKIPVEYYGKHYYFRDWSNVTQICENHYHGIDIKREMSNQLTEEAF